MEQNNRQKQSQLWIGILISVICLGAIFFFIDVRAIIDSLRTARYSYIGLSALGIIAFMLIRAVRWRFMLNNDIPWAPVFHIQNIGYMLTNVLPFRIGDVARAILIGNIPPITMARGISTMVVERIFDLMFIVVLLPFTLAEVETLPLWMRSAAQGSGIIGLTAIVILIIAANQRPLAARVAAFFLDKLWFMETAVWLKRLDDLLAGLNSLTRLRDAFILIVLSILVWLPIILAYYSSLLAVNIQPTLAMAAFVVCAAAFSITIPSSPGQVGVFHAGVTLALAFLGQPEAESASFAFVYHALNMVVLSSMGVVGIYATGATFSQVVQTTQAFIQRRPKTEAT